MKNRIESLLSTAYVIAAILGANAASAQTLASLPTTSAPASPVGEARPLSAWIGFCEREPAECAVNIAEPETIVLTPQTWQAIVTVNRKVNVTIKPVTDQDHWGVADRWDIPSDGMGDCEDFQLLKRKLLAEIGLPRRAMRMTVVVDEKREGHAVLMIRTDRGDVVLDNKTSAVLPWHQTGYVYIKREGQSSMAWVSLGGATSPTVTANP